MNKAFKPIDEKIGNPLQNLRILRCNDISNIDLKWSVVRHSFIITPILKP
jgi:hypothetical protein